MIGISTSSGPRTYWNEWIKKFDTNIVEINLDKSYLPYSFSKLKEKVKPALSGLNKSMHTSAKAIFTDNDSIEEAQQKVLLSELVIANVLEARELVFHMPDDFDFRQDRVKAFLSQLVKTSQEMKVHLLLENNSSGFFSNADHFLELLKEFPQLKVCLDIGHLNVAEKKGLIKSKEEFITKLGRNIVYMHIHDNTEKSDTHERLGASMKDLGTFFGLIKKHSNVSKYIIEVRDEPGMLETYSILKSIL